MERLKGARIGLGCSPMSGGYNPSTKDDDESVEVIRTALDLGVRFLDTAGVYGGGQNEELVGRAIAGRRDEVVLASKGGVVVDKDYPGWIRPDGRPETVAAQVDESLRRLDVDHIDLFYLHRIDPEVPLEETWSALADARAAGKIGALGVCEATLEEARRAHAVHPVSAIQSELSLWTRDPVDSGVLAWTAEVGAAFVPYAPLGRGFLTGTITRNSLEENDFRAGQPRFQGEAFDANLAIVDVVREVAAGHDAAAGQVALAWLLALGEQVLPIPGTRSTRHLAENCGAADLRLTESDLARLEAVPRPEGARY